jgi:hypothetical protein
MLGLKLEDYKKAPIFIFLSAFFGLFNCQFLRLSNNLKKKLFLVTLGHISDISITAVTLIIATYFV